MTRPCFALDTNVLISALLQEDSIPAKALAKAEREGMVIYSYPTLTELLRVLSRPKFLRYISPEDVEGFMARIHRAWNLVHVTHQIRACRDEKDDMFLELAVNGDAKTLISGDNDLLSLSPFRGIEILTPAAFV